MHFRTDLYQHDTLLADALQRKRPAVSALVQLPTPPPQTGVSAEAAPVEAAPVTSEVIVVPDQEEHPTAVE